MTDEKDNYPPLRSWVNQIPLKSSTVVTLCCDSFCIRMDTMKAKFWLWTSLCSPQCSCTWTLQSLWDWGTVTHPQCPLSRGHCPLLLRAPAWSHLLSVPGLASFHPLFILQHSGWTEIMTLNNGISKPSLNPFISRSQSLPFDCAPSSLCQHEHGARVFHFLLVRTFTQVFKFKKKDFFRLRKQRRGM